MRKLPLAVIPNIRTSRIDLNVKYLLIQFLLNHFANEKWNVKMRENDKLEKIVNTLKSMTNFMLVRT